MAGTAVFSGARALFKINTVPIGYAGGVSGEENVDYVPIDVLNLLSVKEHVPVAYRCSMACQIFRVINSPLKSYGDERAEIFPKEDNILVSGEMTATVEDRRVNPGVLPFFMEGIKAASKSWDMSARSVTSENISFVAIRCRDEAEI